MTMKTRREFLRIVSVAASATALGLTGCSGSSNSPDPTPGPSTPTISLSESSFPQGVASGDPRQTAVLLWTRLNAGDGDGTLRVQVATDEGFTQRLVDTELDVLAANDHCLKVRVTGLQAGTTYYYRFLLPRSGNFLSSQTGRTKTARAITDATPVKFAFVSCQDYVGSYFNTLLPLLAQDLDFIVHLGDSIYETTGDPSFQGGNPARSVTFRDPAEALAFGSGAGAFLAARTLSNYRDLHRTYRADDALKRLYARFPVVSIWDDHEFSDDSWQATATYRDGLFQELDVERRRNAEQAFFEYTPVDTDLAGAAGAVSLPRDQLFPRTVLYRKLRFGRDLELFLTDYRSNRPDHLIPEDAFPGTVVMDRAALTQVLALQGIPYDEVRRSFSAYLNIDAPAYAVYKQVLLGALTFAYDTAGLEPGQAALKAASVVTGNIATTVINTFVAQYNAAVPANQRVPALPDALIETLDTGIAWFTMGKTGLFSDLGARYFVVKETFDLYAAYRLLTVGNQTQDALGAAQEQWLISQVASSTAKWKVIASSVSFTSMILDLTPPALGVPAPFNQRFYLNVDQWDGFPQTRRALLQSNFGAQSGVVLISGDIHASFATVHPRSPSGSIPLVEFTTPAISSTPFRTLLQTAANGDATLRPLAAGLIPALDQLLVAGNQNIRYTQTTRHGVSVATTTPNTVDVQILEFDVARSLQSQYAAGTATPDRTVRLSWNGSTLTPPAAQLAEQGVANEGASIA